MFGLVVQSMHQLPQCGGRHALWPLRLAARRCTAAQGGCGYAAATNRNFAAACIHKIIATVIALKMLIYKPFLGFYFFNNREYVLFTCVFILRRNNM